MMKNEEMIFYFFSKNFQVKMMNQQVHVQKVEKSFLLVPGGGGGPGWMDEVNETILVLRISAVRMREREREWESHLNE